MIVDLQSIMRIMVCSVFLFLLTIFSSSQGVRADPVGVEVIATILPSETVLTPVVSIPETTYLAYLELEVRAQAEVEIYINDQLSGVTNSAGRLMTGVMLQDGTNELRIKAKKDGIFSEEVIDSIVKLTIIPSSAGGGAYRYIPSLPVSPKFVSIPEVYASQDLKEIVENVVHENDMVDVPSSRNSGVVVTGEVLDFDKRLVDRAIDFGITHSFTDSDTDGVSDFMELIFDMDITKKDSDADDVIDSQELTDTTSYAFGTFQVDINLKDGQNIIGNNLFIHGSVKELGNESLEKLELCLSREETKSQCAIIDFSERNEFAQTVAYEVDNGRYTAYLKLNDTIYTYNMWVIIFDINTFSDLIIFSIDGKLVYRGYANNFSKVKWLFTYNFFPEVKGFSKGNSVVIALWKAGNGKMSYHTMGLSDLNGNYEIISPISLRPNYGLNKVELYVYAYDKTGTVSGIDQMTFYIVDYLLFVFFIPIFYSVYILWRRFFYKKRYVVRRKTT